MEALKFGAVLVVVVFVQVFGALGTSLSSEDDEMWTADNWQGFPLEKDFTMHLADIIKRSKSHQFHGLMGRSSGRSQPVRLGRKRNKGEMFVGLMGKRNIGEDMEEEWQSDSY
ncbi:tachykinin-4 isoform X1 [Cheilinus undulatus]|uniref:tachykinin-4 isoform X1 n=1 Tax=Cheilinus undulatus TaxID=241271 RepID=UPI001BD3D448|nr:tachykinin-4 isoform X1 [Cheilinus undulatus]